MMKSTTFNRSCVSASGVTEMSTWFEASTGTFVSWLTGTGSSLTSSRLAYSFASIHAGPLQASPDPLVFSTSHGALASTPTRRTPAFLIASMRGLAPGGGTAGVCASAATAMNAPASAAGNHIVVLVMVMLSSTSIFVGEVFVVGCRNLLHRVEHTAQMRLHCLHRAGFIVRQNAAYDSFVFLEYLAQPVRVLER